MRFDEIADKEARNSAAAAEDAVDDHVQPDAPRHVFRHVAMIPHTSFYEGLLARRPLRQGGVVGRPVSAFDISPVPVWRKSCGSEIWSRSRPLLA